MKIELANHEERDRFLVRHPTEVQRILREIMLTNGLVTASADEGKHGILTTIVALEARFVFFDCGADEVMNARLCSCREVLLDTTHEGVRIQFTSPPLQRVRHQQAEVLRAVVPAELLRLQRRASYRLVTSLVDPIKCHIATDQGDIDATVVDLSVGGIGILAYRPEVFLHVGRLYPDCRLSVPNLGQFMVSLIVRNNYEVTLRNGRRSQRAGCQFIDLPVGLEATLQRYITHAERARRNRYL